MPEISEIEQWKRTILDRYEDYLKTSFYFKDKALRESFQEALRQSGSLMKGPFSESARYFKKGISAQKLAEECFPGGSNNDLLPGLLIRDSLHTHQEKAIRGVYIENQNIVVATGTASGKTESFLYPILFELYRQHLDGTLREPGVRAMILYPMNALANDQRGRLGEICKGLEDANSSFKPTFGQYIGQTPENKNDRKRNSSKREEEQLPGELVFRENMRENPPNILLTNYSMLEYLLIRPEDSPIFDGDRGKHWQFIVLDEAHQYRGAKGMEMGMLVRRLKQRLRDGGRKNSFRCIAASATITSGEDERDRQTVANFASELFGESFSVPGIILGEYEPSDNQDKETARRYHLFVRALEGAFLIHKKGKDTVVLNRRRDETGAEPLEIAICRECGQHYYVGKIKNEKLMEAVRDPSQPDFGVDYYLPIEHSDSSTSPSHVLCRYCGALYPYPAPALFDCHPTAFVQVTECKSHEKHPDQIEECANCGSKHGSLRDPVQEIVHGSDGPNAVIATVLHELLPEGGKKVLSFADSRQQAAFFAWYIEDSYTKLRDRNLMLRALKYKLVNDSSAEGLSIQDFREGLIKQWESAQIFPDSHTGQSKKSDVLKAILREALTSERRLSLEGVGLVKWFVSIPPKLKLPELLLADPWNLTEEEARGLLGYLLDHFRVQRAIDLPDEAPMWQDISEYGPVSYCLGPPRGIGRKGRVKEWGNARSTVVDHFLRRLLANSTLLDKDKQNESARHLMGEIWREIQAHDESTREVDRIFSRADQNGAFRLNSRWLRVKLVEPSEIGQCDTCESLSTHIVRNICTRNGCSGKLTRVDNSHLSQNHYRKLYESSTLPPILRAEEHTAQIDSEKAREYQTSFHRGDIHHLSSSTTFEIGVDLGDLEVVFLRDVPPEPFNYVQRIGRAGRRGKPGLALTYCRRNPHDLYHYENPVERVIEGKVSPPRLKITNQKIISRHMVAVALSDFFKQEANTKRFENVGAFVGDWNNPYAVSDLEQFCMDNEELKVSLRSIVPQEMHKKTGLVGDDWVDAIAGTESRLAYAEAEVSEDYSNIKRLREEYYNDGKDHLMRSCRDRLNTIEKESTLDFLARKAIIPKYGFPVDVVELDTHPRRGKLTGISLQQDLSRAIAEYAPGGKVIANKQEWESCGVKTVTGKQFSIKHYSYDDARSFEQWAEGQGHKAKKYLSPMFGFVTPFFEEPKKPSRRPRPLYTTHPFFDKFQDTAEPETTTLLGVQITKAMPGTLVILCEGSNKKGFYICRECGHHKIGRSKSHKTPYKTDCSSSLPLEQFSLGHELVTDVVRLEFPQLTDHHDAYSLAYAVLLGAAETLDVPDVDLNVTISGNRPSGSPAIILYDNVPGGAGLVAQLEDETVFRLVLRSAEDRMKGMCGCDLSCYGCLRSYRNQFAHPYLNRKSAKEFLKRALEFKEMIRP